MPYTIETNRKKLARHYLWSSAILGAWKIKHDDDAFVNGKHLVLASEGCGDVAYLTALGVLAHNIIAVDINSKAIGATQLRFPGVLTHVGDVFGLANRYRGGLSTAYLDFTQTMSPKLAEKAVSFMFDTLRDGGVFAISFSIGRERGESVDAVIEGMLKYDAAGGRTAKALDGRMMILVEAMLARSKQSQRAVSIYHSHIQWHGTSPMATVVFRIARNIAANTSKSRHAWLDKEFAVDTDGVYEVPTDVSDEMIEQMVGALTKISTKEQAELFVNINPQVSMAKVKRNSLAKGDPVLFRRSNGSLQEATVTATAGKGCYIQIDKSERTRFARWSELAVKDSSGALRDAKTGALQDVKPSQPLPKAPLLEGMGAHISRFAPAPEPPPAPPPVGDQMSKLEMVQVIPTPRFSNWLQEWRRNAGLDQATLAAAAGLAKHRVSVIECHRSLADDDELLGLAVLMEKTVGSVTPDWLARFQGMREQDAKMGVKLPRTRFKLKHSKKPLPPPPPPEEAEVPSAAALNGGSEPRSTPYPFPAPKAPVPTSEITVTINGMKITGNPDAIRRLVGLAEKAG